jgi:pimeloyl-ACP methyl ester carboxylesterase
VKVQNKMKKGWKISLIILGSLLLLGLIGPFLIPVRPVKNTQSVQSLADPDSLFIEINDINIHYKSMGSGEPVFILLHGFGANVFTWHKVMEPLSAYGRVIAYDRPAFGLTERPVEWVGENPYTQESNMNLLLGMMDALGIEEAILVGNSAGGTFATAFTLAYPARVTALIEVDAAIYRTVPESAFYDWLIHTPQVDRLGPLAVRLLLRGSGFAAMDNAWHDPSLVENDPEILEGYTKPFTADNWDVAFWEYTKAAAPPDFEGNLDKIKVPTLVISGDDDQIVPVENSIRLAEDIPGSTLVILKNCGHMPQEECPTAFLAAVKEFLSIQ